MPRLQSPVSVDSSEDEGEHYTTEHVSYSKAFLAVMLSAAFGAALGFGLEFMELELPFVVAEILLGSVCAVFTAFVVAMFVEMPDWKRYQRMVPAIGFGGLVGFALFSIWYVFDPPYGFVAIGAIAGICSGFPVAVSFGLLGGECRPLGLLEFSNLLIGFLVGAGLGIFAVEDFGIEACLGTAGLTALIPTFVGGRINLWEIIREINEVLESWDNR